MLVTSFIKRRVSTEVNINKSHSRHPFRFAFAFKTVLFKELTVMGYMAVVVWTKFLELPKIDIIVALPSLSVSTNLL